MFSYYLNLYVFQSIQNRWSSDHAKCLFGLESFFNHRKHNIVVVDNCPNHHSHAAGVLRLWLDQQVIDIIYTPTCTYSPDFKPVEFCCKIKSKR